MRSGNFLMSFFRKLGMDSFAWSLRRFYCPVKKNDLVLEVGSGGNPYFRANVLCDAYFETNERHFDPLIYDRPTVLAFVENLPFKDDSFDFIIASHVLEHSINPEKFLEEIQRVGKAGYIETPDAFMERICAYPMHRLEVSEKNHELLIRKKTAPVHDLEIKNLFVNKVTHIFPKIVLKHPFNFHVRFYWDKNEGIRNKIINSEYQFDWNYEEDAKKEAPLNFKMRVRKIIIKFLRKILSQNNRNKKINILDYLKCVKCGSELLEKEEKNAVKCVKCGHKYPILNDKIIDFTK